MSEKVAEVPKKKKGVLPVIVAVVLVLGGGGFFAYRAKTAKADKPAIVLADKEIDIDEFLVNLQGGATYLRTKIAVKLRKDFDEAKFKNNMGAVQDAIILVLRSTNIEELRSAEDIRRLKRRIASSVNAALGEAPSPADKTAKPAVDDPAGAWDSRTGPVLEVFFKSFATQ